MLLLATAVSSLPSHLLVVSLVLCEDFLSHLLLSLMDVRVKFVSVLLDRELLVIVDWNEDFLCANWLFLWVMELLYVWMLQGLLSCQTFVWVEL